VQFYLAKYESVVLCGYSLGGAVATLVAAQALVENAGYITSMHVVTLGAPLVGDDALAQWLDKVPLPRPTSLTPVSPTWQG
jgi:pimeloyl-ACP methyl ester carboxylesterase